FPVPRSGDAEGSQSVAYTLSGIEATDISDPLTGSVTFAQGVTEQTITVHVVDDHLDEVNETLTATLSNPQGTVVDPTISATQGAASTTINDNDDATVISITADDAAVDEDAGTITFTGTRSGDAEGSQSVAYTLSGIAATDISDPLTGSVTSAQGVAEQTITVRVVDDHLDEVNETLTATLS